MKEQSFPNEYKLWDKKEKSFITNPSGSDISCTTVEDAAESRDEYLYEGNYPDMPMSVIEIMQYRNGTFIKIIP